MNEEEEKEVARGEEGREGRGRERERGGGGRDGMTKERMKTKMKRVW